MAKTKTSKRQKIYSVFDLPIAKPLAGSRPFDPLKGMDQRKETLAALGQCLADGDAQGFKEILSAHLRAVNKRDLTKRLRMGRTTLYEALSPEGNPSLETITKIVHSILA